MADKLQEAISFVAEQVATAEEQLKDGFQGRDLLAFLGPAMSAPALVSKENRQAIVAAWKATREQDNGMETLRAHIKAAVHTANPKLEAKIEKGAIILFDVLDFIGDFTDTPPAPTPTS